MTTPEKSVEGLNEARDTFIHFLMGVHGFTKQGQDKETQQSIDEAVAWFDDLIEAERQKRGEMVEEIRKLYVNEDMPTSWHRENAHGYNQAITDVIVLITKTNNHK